VKAAKSITFNPKFIKGQKALLLWLPFSTFQAIKFSGYKNSGKGFKCFAHFSLYYYLN
jgi:hypothetical protein